MKRPLLSLAAILSMFFISCQKEISTELPQRNNGTNSNDSIYLSKIYLVDSTAAGEDTTDRWTWFYDSQRRVVRITDTLSISAGGNNDIEELCEYYYAGTDTVPFRSMRLTGLNLPDTSITWHTYLPNGKKLKDSVWTNSNASFPLPAYTTVTNYSYNTSKVYGTTFSDIAGVFEMNAIDTATLDADGNVLSSRRYYKEPISGTFILSGTSTIKYDNHPSPFSLLSNKKAYPVFPDYETLLYVTNEYVQNNNILLIQQESRYPFLSTYESEDLTNTFTYNPNGYPSFSRYTDPSVPGEAVKIIFKYRNL